MARLSDLRKVKEQKDPLVILDSMIKDHNKNKPRDFSSLLESVNTKDKIIKAKNAVINADKAVESVPTNSASQIATIRKKLDLDKEQLEPIENLITDMLDTQREELTTELTNNFQVQLGRVMEVADFALRQANSARLLASGGSDGGGSSVAAIRDLVDDKVADSLGSIDNPQIAEITNSVALSANRLIRYNGSTGEHEYASADNLNHAESVYGITMTGGTTVQVRLTGNMQDSSWNSFQIGESVFLKLNGTIGTVPDPSSKFVLLVGRVTGIGQITFDFGNPPIILDNS